MSSKKDTKKHIRNVQKYMMQCVMEMCRKSIEHDLSKLKSPEKEYFDEFTPLLKNSTYGSEKYFDILKSIKPALDHHYKNNSHHPEFWKNGIDDMNLMDVIEMFCDWYAASQRHDNGDIYKSININQKRFNISDQLANIFRNTVIYLDNINK